MDVSKPELREARLTMARELLYAIEIGDEPAARRSAEMIACAYGSEAWRELERIVTELRAVLSRVGPHGQAREYNGGEQDDAQMQLRQIIEITESAANSTLTAVETALPLAGGVMTLVENFRVKRGADLVPDRELDSLLNRVAGNAEALKAQLSEVLVAQGFQDLTGQIIRRVVELVRELEGHVARSGGPVRESLPTGLAESRSDRGRGPARPGDDDASVVRGQHDVDALLSDMGL